LKGHEVARLDPEALADTVTASDTGLAEFEAVVLDCPPGWDHLERLGLVTANLALIVVDAHPFAIQGAARVIEDLKARQQKGRQGAQRWALVMSRVDPRRALDKELDAALSASFPGINRLLVRQDVALAAATTERTPIMEAAPRSRGATDLQALVEWLIHA
jgi:chromosome partitioning protein